MDKEEDIVSPKIYVKWNPCFLQPIPQCDKKKRAQNGKRSLSPMNQEVNSHIKMIFTLFVVIAPWASEAPNWRAHKLFPLAAPAAQPVHVPRTAGP